MALRYHHGTIRDRPLSGKMHDEYDSTTQQYNEDRTKIRFYDLHRIHFPTALLAGGEARRTEKHGKYILEPVQTPCWFYPYLNLEFYFSYIQDYVDFMKGSVSQHGRGYA